MDIAKVLEELRRELEHLDAATLNQYDLWRLKINDPQSPVEITNHYARLRYLLVNAEGEIRNQGDQERQHQQPARLPSRAIEDAVRIAMQNEKGQDGAACHPHL